MAQKAEQTIALGAGTGSSECTSGATLKHVRANTQSAFTIRSARRSAISIRRRQQRDKGRVSSAGELGVNQLLDQ